MLRRFSSTFVAGLFAVLPLVVTIALIIYLVTMVNSWIGPASRVGDLLRMVSRDNTWIMVGCYVASLAVVMLVIWLVGYFATRVAGRRFGLIVASLMGRVPFVNKVYSSVEQVVGLLRQGGQHDAASALANVVFVKIANTTILGMLASSQAVEINGVRHMMVYFPSSPIPATGFNYLVPETDVWDANVSVEDMTKIILSLGSLGPSLMNLRSPLAMPLGSAKQPTQAT